MSLRPIPPHHLARLMRGHALGEPPAVDPMTDRICVALMLAIWVVGTVAYWSA